MCVQLIIIITIIITADLLLIILHFEIDPYPANVENRVSS